MELETKQPQLWPFYWVLSIFLEYLTGRRLQRRKSAYELGVAISNRTKIEPFSISCSKHSYRVAKRFKEDDILKNGILESVGDGKYLVRVGDGYVQSASGPFILDLRSNSGPQAQRVRHWAALRDWCSDQPNPFVSRLLL
jgi:hypothetical protein